MNAHAIRLRGLQSGRFRRRTRATGPAPSSRPRVGESGRGDTGLQQPPSALRAVALAPPPEAAAHAPPRPAAHARALQPAAVSARKPRLARRARCPARLRPLGGAPSHPARRRAAASRPLRFYSRSWARAPPTCGRARAEGAELDRGRKRQAKRASGAANGAGSGARARSRLSLPQSTSGQNPTQLPRAARLAAPNNNGARGQVAARGQRRHWPGGERGAPGLAGGRGLVWGAGGAVEGGGQRGGGGGARPRSAPLCPARALRPLRLHQ